MSRTFQFMLLGAIESMPVEWRYRWCSREGGCACLGCANGSGRLEELGVTKAEWAAWVDSHPQEPMKAIDPIDPNRLDPKRIPD